MSELKTDRDLLREYIKGGVEGAFQTLVQRHLDLVFATALRGLNDNGAAQEITQNVFVSLARKASWLGGEKSLAGWLHKATLLEVRHWWRGEFRRQRREQTAVELGTVMKDDDSILKTLASELDEALLGLREADRQALMLRYFEGRSHREIGLLLGAREDAVRMRVTKALERLTQLFRRRGFAVPAVATIIALLGATAKAAPAGLALAATHAALAAGGGAATGIKLFIAKLMGLSKTQTAVLCLALAAVPAAWEAKVSHKARTAAAEGQAKLVSIQQDQDLVSSQIERLRADGSRLDADLAEAVKLRDRYDAAAQKLEALRTRVRGLLTEPDYQWPGDLPYVRVPKATVASLDLLHKPPMAFSFSSSGAMSEPALELFAITAQEKAPTEQALGNYWQGINALMASAAYETNLPATEPGRITKTVIVPPLGQPVKDLASATRERLTEILGADREQLLFGDWADGGIQLFAPGNVWPIAEDAQTFTVWVEPHGGKDGGPRHGASRSSRMGGMSSDDTATAGMVLDTVPPVIAQRFFQSWLQGSGISMPERASR